MSFWSNIGYASNSAAQITRNATASTNITLLSLQSSQSGVPPQKDYTRLFSSVDKLFGGQYHNHGSVATASTTFWPASMSGSPSNGRQTSVESILKGVGGHFGDVQSTSSATGKRQ